MEAIRSATAAEIDTILAANWTEQTRERHYAASERAIVQRWGAETRNGADAQKRLEDHLAKLEQLQEDAAPYEAEFVRRGGWTRYFLVSNTNGHVHRERDCSTCFPSTQFGWLPQLSDCDEAAMVAEWGEMACTVCFPDAPTMKGFGDGTSALARYSAAERAARDAEKAAKAAAKAAKAINDAGELRVPTGRGYYDVVRTIVSAKRMLANAVDSLAYYGPDHPSDFIGQADVLVAALRARGVDDAEIAKTIANANKKTADTYAKARYELPRLETAAATMG